MEMVYLNERGSRANFVVRLLPRPNSTHTDQRDLARDITSTVNRGEQAESTGGVRARLASRGEGVGDGEEHVSSSESSVRLKHQTSTPVVEGKRCWLRILLELVVLDLRAGSFTHTHTHTHRTEMSIRSGVSSNNKKTVTSASVASSSITRSNKGRTRHSPFLW